MADLAKRDQLALEGTGQRLLTAVNALNAGLAAAGIVVPPEIPDSAVEQMVDEEW